MTTTPISQSTPSTDNVAALADERARRLKVEVERLAGLPAFEALFWAEDAAQRHGIEPAKLMVMIKATQAEREKAKRKAEAELEHTAKRAKTVEREAKADASRARKDEERASKQAERKRKAIAAELKTLLTLPTAAREKRLVELAGQFDVDVEELRAELEVLLPRGGGKVELWPEPVEIAELLCELRQQVQRYVVIPEGGALAVTLWTMLAWLHDRPAVVHSPILTVTSAEPNSGKTTLAGVLERLVPEPYLVVELTGPGLFHVVDYLKPTLIIDEADRLFERRNDLLHVVNSGWTRGTKITRIVRGLPREFDPWSPKIIALKGMALPSTLASRAITIRLLPKLEDERVEDFNFSDSEQFELLRRKAARWARDHGDNVAATKPAMPLGFVNRLGANWRTLFAIAELAGCLKQAHDAAVTLSSRRSRQVSEGVRLLAAVRQVFGSRNAISSSELVRKLTADGDGEWCEFRHGSPITKRQVALLLDQYDIHPVPLHVGARSTTERGYRAEWFADVFARYLPSNRASVSRTKK